jgi:TPP-dependent pyruvate/acetoin dehydrogenase alpha subunit
MEPKIVSAAPMADARPPQRAELAALDQATLRAALKKMHLIRRFEETAEASYMRGLIHGTMHLSIGQEASAVGAILPLRIDDYILSTHRGHGHCIAKGADPARMLAEFFGKENGYCRGRGGSMHIADIESGNLGANGIVAGGLPIAVGVGMSIKAQKQDRVCMVFFGDGAAPATSARCSWPTTAPPRWRSPSRWRCRLRPSAGSPAAPASLPWRTATTARRWERSPSAIWACTRRRSGP